MSDHQQEALSLGNCQRPSIGGHNSARPKVRPVLVGDKGFRIKSKRDSKSQRPGDYRSERGSSVNGGNFYIKPPVIKHKTASSDRKGSTGSLENTSEGSSIDPAGNGAPDGNSRKIPPIQDNQHLQMINKVMKLEMDYDFSSNGDDKVFNPNFAEKDIGAIGGRGFVQRREKFKKADKRQRKQESTGCGNIGLFLNDAGLDICPTRAEKRAGGINDVSSVQNYGERERGSVISSDRKTFVSEGNTPNGKDSAFNMTNRTRYNAYKIAALSNKGETYSEEKKKCNLGAEIVNTARLSGGREKIQVN